ncbi:hypothetical protein P4U97_01090 [Bacillus swezeyi]|uniref:hypothetical protein n=1 Tax=Bacillus swezeyi TaxID=1925020 RepID=UPI002E23A902|nr:hypothetical protein [Bacillus swezeyi]
MKVNLKKDDKFDETSALHQRQKKLFFLILGIFIGCLSLYFYSLFGDENKVSNTPKSSIAKDESKVHQASVIKEEKALNSDKDRAAMQQVLSHFVKKYYSYDQKNSKKHLEDSKEYLTPEFYKELSMSEEKTTTVPPFAYRIVKGIAYSDYQTVNDTPHWTLEVNAELQDEKKKKYSSIDVEFVIDLEKRKDDWKVAYFAVTGKGIQENE